MHLVKFKIPQRQDYYPSFPTVVLKGSSSSENVDVRTASDVLDDPRKLMNSDDFSLKTLIETNSLQTLKPCVITSSGLVASDYAESAFISQSSNVENNE